MEACGDFMSYIARGFARLFKYIPQVARFIPLGFAGLFVVTQFIIDWFTKGFAYAMAHAGQTIFAAELTINQMTHLAIIDSPEYGFGEFIAIAVSVLIMYSVVKWTGRGVRKLIGGNESFGEYVVGIFILSVVSAASIKVIDGVFGFIPIRDSIVFLLKNLGPVLGNIF